MESSRGADCAGGAARAHPLHEERGIVVAARVLQRAVHGGVDVPARARRTLTACTPCSSASCRRWRKRMSAHRSSCTVF